MSETSINARVQTGGVVGVAGAGYVHIENLTQYAAASTPAPAPAAGPIPPCPYPGLAYFGPQDSGRFFGRETAIEALDRAVLSRSFTALIGASGSGKSSVVLAGLAPRLDAKGGWRFSHFRVGTEPDKNPFAALARALVPLLGAGDIIDKLGLLERLAGNLVSGGIALPSLIAQCRIANPGKRVLLIADQFEEVFTLVGDEALRNRFIDALIAAFPDPSQGSSPDICLILTLRADFYAMALRHRPLADRLQDRVENLGPMTRDELRDAIVKPAAQCVPPVEFEPGLVDAILDDVEMRPSSLPLLQFALREMWGRLEKPLMTRAVYDSIGGVEGALAKRAQAIFDEATKHGEDVYAVALFRRLFTRLVTLGEGAEDTRRIVGRAELGPDAWALAQRLADEGNRLVVTAAPAPGQETAEVVHEALIRNWPALVEWVSRDRAFQSWLRQLKPRVEEWAANPTDEGTLLRGGPLAVAEDWIGRRSGEVNEEEKAFVAASAATRDEENRRAEEDLKREESRLTEMGAAQAKTARAQRGARWALGAVAAVIVVASGIFYWQYWKDSVKLAEGRMQLAGAQSALSARQKDLADAQTALTISRDDLRKQQATVADLQRSLDAKQIELTAGQKQLAEAQAALGASREDLRTQQTAAADLQRSLDAKQLELTVGQKQLAEAQSALTTSRDDLHRQQTATTELQRSLDAKQLELTAGQKQIAEAQAALGTSRDDLRKQQTAAAELQRSLDVKQLELKREHANLLGELASAELSQRNFASALRFATLGAHEEHALVPASLNGSIASAYLAASVAQTPWRVVLAGHTGAVHSAQYSRDGSLIVTVSDDKTARIWDANSGRQIGDPLVHDGGVISVAFSPDGSRIATGSRDGTARVWDVGRRRQIIRPLAHGQDVTSVSFSPDGSQLVTGSRDGKARVWEVATGELVGEPIVSNGMISSAAFSPDGQRIVIASGFAGIGEAIFEAASRRLLTVFKGQSILTSAAFSPDGSRVVTASQDHSVKVWDANTGSEVLKLPHDTMVNDAVFSPDSSRIATASWDDKSVRIWDTTTGAEMTELYGHGSFVNSVAFSPDGTHIVTASSDGTARIWSIADGIGVVKNADNAIRAAYIGFGYMGKCNVTARGVSAVPVRGAEGGGEVLQVLHSSGGVTSAAFSPDGSLVVTASTDKSARIWDAVTGKELGEPLLHEDSVTSAAFDTQGKRVVTSSADNTARIWDLATRTERGNPLRHDACVLSAKFSPDGSRVVTASTDKTARIWDATSGAQIGGPITHTKLAMAAAFSPDGRRIVTASQDNFVRIWDSNSEQEILPELNVNGLAWSSEYSRDGLHIAAGTNSSARVWNTTSSSTPITLYGHQGNVYSAQFSPDGSRIVTASADHSARIFDVRTGVEIAKLLGHKEGVKSAAFNPDGAHVVTASADETAIIWDVHFATMSTEDLIIEACTRRLNGLTKQLTRDEMRLAGYPDSESLIDVCSPGAVTASSNGLPAAPVGLLAPTIVPPSGNAGADPDAARKSPASAVAEASNPALKAAEPFAPTGVPQASDEDPLTKQCDRLAAPSDGAGWPIGLPGRASVSFDAPRAVSACRSALSARPTDSRVQYALARALASTGAFNEAVTLVKQAADSGYSTAQASLGGFYESGRGVNQDYPQALAWLQKAADQEEVAAQLELGRLFEFGRGVARDNAQAMLWFRKAADRGDAQAQLSVAILYENGQGVERDYAQAMAWLKKAADQGSAPAELSIGTLYESGRGVDKDYAQAFGWFKKAGDQGVPGAQFNVGRLYLHGLGVESDYTQAMAWFKRAADRGYAPAQVSVGLLYQNGQGVDKDQAQAMAWFKKAADQGPQTQVFIGRLFESGQILGKDSAQAKLWYQKAANQGYAAAQSALGGLFEFVDKDSAQAKLWYQRAADQGDQFAKAGLQRLQSPSNPLEQTGSANPAPITTQAEKSTAPASPLKEEILPQTNVTIPAPSAYAEPGVRNMFCVQADFHQWDSCVGTHTSPDGNVYRGEFHNGTREGFGIIAINARGIPDENSIRSNERSEYIGEFRGDRLNGHGIWFTASGAGSPGTFVNNIPQSDVSQRNCTGPLSSAWTNCVATFSYNNGNFYRGEFVQGLRQGVGLLEINARGASDTGSIRTPEPGTYIGEFNGGRLNGHGVIMLPDAGFYGLFTNNIFTPPKP
jgi:WD40 repeat protein/TPR repeat protein